MKAPPMARIVIAWERLPVEGDERELVADIVERVIDRLCTGFRDYGALDVRDGRDWVSETHDELTDGLVYAQAELLRRQRQCRCDDENVCDGCCRKAGLLP